MRAGATHIEAFRRAAVLRVTRERTVEQHLVERQVALEDVAFGEAGFILDDVGRDMQPDCLDNPFLRGVRDSEDLAFPRLSGRLVIVDEIGERPADVDANARGHCLPVPVISDQSSETKFDH